MQLKSEQLFIIEYLFKMSITIFPIPKLSTQIAIFEIFKGLILFTFILGVY